MPILQILEILESILIGGIGGFIVTMLCLIILFAKGMKW